MFFITGGLAMFVLAPIYKRAFAPLASYKDVRPLVVWAHIYKIMWRSISSKGYRDLYPQKLTDPPEFSNSPTMRIKESWQGASDNCDLCPLSCCAQINCPMLSKNGRCLSYGSLYFGYLFCGRYPSNQGQIDLYDCPKWEVGSNK
ncbi:MAG: hypothetical protein FWE24_10080 [Defluviitaleaceae bacterium]|nr:hypothetical protein [Defluviitaleaceae bacterium]